jgi:beta-phosphoglucomutase-like phosphatase (HAD superfamily)
MLRGVIFDMDGVIVDREHLWALSWGAFAAARANVDRRGQHGAAKA